MSPNVWIIFAALVIGCLIGFEIGKYQTQKKIGQMLSDLGERLKQEAEEIKKKAEEDKQRKKAEEEQKLSYINDPKSYWEFLLEQAKKESEQK